MASEELKAFESKSEVPPVHDPLGDFLSGGMVQGGNPQHFAEPIRDETLRDSLPSSQGGKIIDDTMSFLQHESQHHFAPAAVDNPYSGSLIDTEDYSLDDEVIRHKTPSPDILPPEPVKSQHSALDNPLDDFGASYGFSSKKNSEPPRSDIEDFFLKPEIKPAPQVVQEPTPDPFREPSPEPIKEPTPEPFREPTPELVREPTHVRDPTPEPSPKPKAAPVPPFLELELVEKKQDKKEPEPKPLISKPTSPPPAPPKQVSSGENKSCDGLAIWFNPQRMHPTVEALVYWRDPKKSGIVFGGVMVVLLSLTFFSFISVIAYLSLLALCAAFGFRIYKTIQQAIQKTSDGHPFKEILELDLALPSEKVRQTSDLAVTHINAIVSELRRLFLVEDFIDSLKFGLGLWMLTYVGSWINGMTLIIIGVVALFTLPKVYETNKAQIDQNVELVAAKLNEITAKVKAAIPIGKKAEEKKEQ